MTNDTYFSNSDVQNGNIPFVILTVIHVLSNYKCQNFFSPMKRKFCFITVFNVYLLFVILSQHQMIKLGFRGCL